MFRKEYFGRAIAIVGLQFGSEGKGAITEYLSPVASAAVRIGASNAGHTVFYKGASYVMRCIPCSFVNPTTKLIIGVSAIIHLPTLLQEINEIEKVIPIKHRLFIDERVHITTESQILAERQTTLAERISSTSSKGGLGIGATQADKIMRSEHCLLAKDVPVLREYTCDTVSLLNTMLEHDQFVIFEGTQGFGLSIDHGYFPYTTSRDTTAQSLFAGTGVNPYPFDVEVIGVARALPIRVGGPSGPFDSDSRELSWEEVRSLSGAHHCIEERTSVTNSVRRIATFSFEGVKRACRVNRASEIALTFLDYVDSSIFDQNILSTPARAFMERVEHECGATVGIAKTGPHSLIDFNLYRANMLRRIA